MTKTFTEKELQEYDGCNGKPTYVGYQGKVYDVSKSDLFEEGEHYEHYAGQDLTEAMGDAPHEEEVMEAFPVVGELKG